MHDRALGPIGRIGHRVADLDHGISRWRARHDAGLRTIFRTVRLDGRYLGEAVTLTSGPARAPLHSQEQTR
ncbi:hypothetical protein [Burkholderia sp. 22313]|uniref:hypothetical protein n=1 Tax=Burkholderia sp. 22313 TaxID=3453908 RepID=UPI002C190CCE|nr:hypothetical protein [Burkholderia sp.]